MKKLLSILPMLAFIMGISMAFATQSTAVEGVKKAFIGNEWTPIPPELIEGIHYDCDQEEDFCTQLFDENDQPIPGTLVMGTYTPRNP